MDSPAIVDVGLRSRDSTSARDSIKLSTVFFCNCRNKQNRMQFLHGEEEEKRSQLFVKNTYITIYLQTETVIKRMQCEDLVSNKIVSFKSVFQTVF